MKRNLWLVPALALTLTGCSASQKTEPIPAKPAVPVIVFNTNPAPLHVNQEGNLIATVTVNNDPVKKATVEFEIWGDSDTAQHEKIPATGDDQGHYSLKKSFAKADTYHVTIHTTTAELHTMPTMDFQVTQ
ncbi:FixH family protein [Tumebacillus sp. ITR2]|uniref:FixH family protein n=1 Tax=Tumebacillus amylolyticus TaxID=2801339 RepID=A0ABS1JD52_9BACL|nr:FixH family protein [Tumebacillus amylolyticus]MBL0388209.1 FixH family protein [Tumebacillus amylolyticus]